MQPKSLFLGVLLLSMGFIGCAQNANLPVDLGLSVNWAANNIGASSPTEYGVYLAWGKVSLKKHL